MASNVRKEKIERRGEMARKVFRSRLWLVMGLSLILGIPAQEAFAWGGYRPGHSRYEIVVSRGNRYHYREGRFYRPSLFGFIIVAPPIGAIVTTLPFGYSTIVVGGMRYYRHGNVYYQPCPSGYIVTSRPVIYSNVITPPLPQVKSGEAIIINVPNANGSYTPVQLIKIDKGYLGPQGEYYPDHPTVEQLIALYGK